jgi:two-component system sensor histidine kinase KdpD
MEPRRPSPEEMLARAASEAETERRGRLKIFFGAAPGVGKTYAMLEAGQARKREGVDVVLGWVETHGRAETEALTRGFEHLPSRVVEHRGLTLHEFDLDAALARRPGLILVDELPHTNAPGSRHARRWQDIEELLDAGLDVYTTLNVQHLESLNDVVAIVTGVAVTETVPDSILDRATDIELVDLPPDELLQRLREGKVYVPAQADRAMRNFFRKGNLIALRELVMRRAAERVDAQVTEWRRGEGAGRPVPTRERLLVAVGAAPQSADLVRAAYRMAARLRAPWIALSVENPASDRMSARDRERVGAHLALAERLGGETLVVRGEHVADEILAAARERNVSRIIVGKPGRSRWRERLQGSLVESIVRGSSAIDVLVTSGEEGEPERAAPRPAATKSHRPADYGRALGVVVVTTAICWATRRQFTLADQSMIYLLGVLVAASRLPRGPSLVAAVASVAALDFFFVPPFLTFNVSDLRFVITFTVMLVVGVTVSHLTHRIRQQAETARRRERRSAALYAMIRDFAVETSVDDIAAAAVRQVRDLLETDAVVFMVDAGGRLVPRVGLDSPLAASDREIAVARWVYDHGRPAGYESDTLPASEGYFLPLVGTADTLGVFGVGLGRARVQPTPAQRQLLETFVAQTALALERALLAERAQAAEVGAETERARSALLSAVSHDLRTPLASITGTASMLLDDDTPLAAPARRELLKTIHDETERLSRLIANLLDLTRLDSGALEVRKELCPLEELVGAALQRVRRLLQGRDLRVDLPADVLLVPVDPVLAEQVLVNLLENALRYSPPGSPLEVTGAVEGDVVAMSVADRGGGIPPGEEEHIFERFYRLPDGARTHSTGLGLTICRAIVHAHGGEIRAENRDGGGAVFRFTLPLGGASQALAAMQSEPEPENEAAP